jgi:DNA gyrase inhibitor GyrI
MDMNIETIPSYSIVYIRQKGPYGEKNKQTMEKLKSLTGSNGLLDDESIILGIAQDDPATTKPQDCRYDACLVVTAHYRITDASLCHGIVPGGKYAVFIIDHTAEAIKKAWREIFSELSGYGYHIDATRPIIERYAVKVVNRHKCEICVPVA